MYTLIIVTQHDEEDAEPRKAMIPLYADLDLL